MGFSRGPNATTVTEGLVNSISLRGMEGTASSDSNGSFVYSGYKTNTGCDNSVVYIELKDPFAWNRISCRFIINGHAACWTFNTTGGWNPGHFTPSGNLLGYDASAGDVFTEARSLNSWGVEAFQSHDRTAACDNNANNFYHGSFQTGNPKMFLMRRRRNTSGNLAGIYHASACHLSGTGHNITIKDIKIWQE